MEHKNKEIVQRGGTEVTVSMTVDSQPAANDAFVTVKRLDAHSIGAAVSYGH